MSIQETWLPFLLPQIANAYTAQSVPHNSQDVAIITNNRNTHMQSIHPQLWSPALFAIKVRIKDSQMPIYLVNHYTTHHNTSNNDEELIYCMVRKRYHHSIRERSKQSTLDQKISNGTTVAGVLNQAQFLHASLDCSSPIDIHTALLIEACNGKIKEIAKYTLLCTIVLLRLF